MALHGVRHLQNAAGAGREAGGHQAQEAGIGITLKADGDAVAMAKAKA